MNLAAIDLGTNSCKLLVADRTGSTVLHLVRATRLGEGLAASGRLSNEAMTRTAAAVAELIDAARSVGAADARVAGTAACRDASNLDEWRALLRAATGVELEVLDPAAEASLGFVGALSGLVFPHRHGSPDGAATADDPPLTAVIDIGGGSTDISVGSDRPEESFSLPFGAVVSSETALTRDPPAPEQLSNLIGAVMDELEESARAVPLLGRADRHVGIAGTIVTVAAVELGLATFDERTIHGMTLTRAAAEDVFRTLATESIADRRHNPGLPPERSDIIVGGCCILVAVMRRLRLDALTVSTRGLVHGLVREMSTRNS